MTHVEGFDNFDDMMRYMQQKEQEANESVVDEQRGISYGDYWCRPVPELRVFVFGRVHTPEDITNEEGPDEIAMLRDSYSRGYRYGLAYSAIEKDGEYGSTHIANMWPITEDDFNEAKEHDWLPSKGFIERVFAEMDAARERG